MIEGAFFICYILRMQTCSNCNAHCENGTTDASDANGLIVKHGEVTVAAICADCVSGVKTCKIVLTRNGIRRLVYEQYSALEMEKKAFGR